MGKGWGQRADKERILGGGWKADPEEHHKTGKIGMCAFLEDEFFRSFLSSSSDSNSNG